jgi:hypothetical protein
VPTLHHLSNFKDCLTDKKLFPKKKTQAYDTVRYSVLFKSHKFREGRRKGGQVTVTKYS